MIKKKSTSKAKGHKTSNALLILSHLSGKGVSIRQEIAQARINTKVAQLIYDARTNAGLTQKELADLIGTKQPVIARLEDADYEGHSLSMLQKIASVLDRRIELSLPLREKVLRSEATAASRGYTC
jgi:ribosome-binding protein aMBF1 (putative translation factor)